MSADNACGSIFGGQGFTETTGSNLCGDEQKARSGAFSNTQMYTHHIISHDPPSLPDLFTSLSGVEEIKVSPINELHHDVAWE